jgi:preprotein translocase subunit SecE
MGALTETSAKRPKLLKVDAGGPIWVVSPASAKKQPVRNTRPAVSGVPDKKDAAMAVNPIEFVNEVRQEVSKVTWPTFREVWITTILVGIMVTVASLFFLLADQILGSFVKVILSLGS